MNVKIINLTIVTVLFLGGCAGGMPSKQDTGAVLGGAIGGVAGSQVGGGKGRTAATIVGTILGAVVGGAIGASMDQSDRLQATRALEYNRTGQGYTWNNPDTKASYTVTPTKTYQSTSGTSCRDYTTVGMIDGKRETIQGTACRQPDGTWQSM